MEKPPSRVRESKKAVTRQALLAAAHRRFHRDGYAQTTIEDICADANVSRRTFFRYFPDKQALAFPHRAERLQRFLQLLDSVPARDNPVDGLRLIARTFSDAYSASRDQLVAQQHLIDTVPELSARENEIDRDWEAAMATVFRKRFGRGPAADLRARVMAGAAIGVIRATLRYWFDHEGQPDLGELGMRALDGLERGFLP